MTQPQDNAPEQEIPTGPQAPPVQEDSGPETEAEQREREIQRRLTQSGREAAEARRQAATAQQVAAAQAAQITELQSTVRLLTEHANASQRAQAEERQRQIEAELASLPPADRLERKIELLQGQITSLQTAAPQARPVQQTPPAPQSQQTQPQAQREPTDDERAAYMEQRVKQIVEEAQNEFGVRVDLDQIPDGDWESEESFYRSVMKQAALGARNGGETVPPQKKAAETPAQMRDRIRQEEREKLGVNSPTAPRATPAPRKKAPDEAEVRASVQSYDSKLGPKANLKRLQELRQSMG
jgi:hypothetical protein